MCKVKNFNFTQGKLIRNAFIRIDSFKGISLKKTAEQVYKSDCFAYADRETTKY